MRLESDLWLASIFCNDVFRVIDIERVPLISVDDLIRASDSQQFFFYVKVPVERLDLVHALNNSGFKVVDVNVTFECMPRETEINLSSRTIVRVARPEDCDTTLDIAKTCFTYSRFHQDPLIKNVLANLIKREWVANYFKGDYEKKITEAAIKKTIGVLIKEGKLNVKKKTL